MNDSDQAKNTKKLIPVILMIGAIVLVLGGFWMLKASQDNHTPPTLSSTEQLGEESAPKYAKGTNQNLPEAIIENPSKEIEKPVKIDVPKILAERGLGDKNAPIKMVEYASLTCSHCAHFHNDILPVLKEKYIDKGLVYLEFIEFPLNDPALKATITARCLPADKYGAFVSLLFKSQDQWAGGINYMAALKQYSKLAGLGDGEFEACHASSAVKLGIADNIQKAQDKWKIDSTPTFIINDGKEKIEGAVAVEEFERVFRKVSGNKIGTVSMVE